MLIGGLGGLGLAMLGSSLRVGGSRGVCVIPAALLCIGDMGLALGLLGRSIESPLLISADRSFATWVCRLCQGVWVYD